MRKRHLLTGLIFIIAQQSFAQTVKPELINFTERAAEQKAHPDRYKKCATCQEKEIDNGWRNLQSELPVPKTGLVKKQAQNLPSKTPTPKEARPAETQEVSPAPAKNFAGYIDPGENIPPDTHGAVGPNHVVTATNDFVIVHNKNTGAELGRVTLSAFTGVSTTCDPYIQYDPETQRWFLSAINCDANDGNPMAVLVSNSSDPSGTWRKYTFTPSNSYFLDHPYLGFNEKWVVVSGRKFPGLNYFDGPVLFLLDKANLINGSTITFGVNAQRIEKTADEGDSPLPVTVLGSNPEPGTFYILQNWNGSASAIRLSTVTGNIPNAEWNTSSAVYIIGGTPWNSLTGAVAEQADESRRLATNDARISTGIMMNGNIWCAHHIGISDDNVAVQWWQINGHPGNGFGNILQRGRIGEGLPNNYRYYPSIIANQNEDVLIGYTVSTNVSRVSSAYSTRSSLTPPNTTDDEYIYKVGLSTYYKDFGSGRGRWGDYSHSALDPTDGSLWTIQEYADARNSTSDNGSRFGVWWAKVNPISTLEITDASVGAVISPDQGIYCNSSFRPSVTVRNLGKDTLKSVQLGMLLDDIQIGPLVTVSNLALPTFSMSSPVTFPLITPAAGDHNLKFFTVNPNNSTDLRSANDTTNIYFTIPAALTLPYTESFEEAVFPPNNGTAVINDDEDKTWELYYGAGRPGDYSMRMDFFEYGADVNGNLGQHDIYQLPKIDVNGLDSVRLSFNVAYQQYFGPDVNAPLIDSLNIVYSPDCGVNWYNAGYAKGGASLSTAPNSNQAFVPNADQWRTETVVIKNFCEKNLDNIIIGFEAVNRFGNNLYIDSINVVGFSSFNNNALIKSLTKPPLAVCDGKITPAISFGNAGQDTLKSLNINYRIDDGAVSTYNWTGSLLKCDSVKLNLPTANAAVGTHVLTVYTSLPNGQADEAPGNDTLRQTFSVYSPVATPVKEDFESNTIPANNWGIQNVNGGTSFERSTLAAKSGNASLEINNPNAINFNGAVDYYVSPIVINDPKADSIFAEFDYAYQQGPQYPGSTVFPLDTLEVLATKDCGVTFTSIWKKWGSDLQTISDPNFPSTGNFVPASAEDWKHVKIYVDPFVGSSNYQLYFAMKGNKQNNLWLDNVNIWEQTLPEKLKLQGYLIYPNPFNNTFLLHHHAVQPPTDLKALIIYNSAGQEVWHKEYKGNAERQINIDLSGKARGLYLLKMIYSKRTIVERIVKNG